MYDIKDKKVLRFGNINIENVNFTILLVYYFHYSVSLYNVDVAKIMISNSIAIGKKMFQILYWM